MYLVDSLLGYQSTEPIWFRYFRGFVAIILTLTIIYYSFNQFQKINLEANTIITNEIIDTSFIIKLCTGISNNMTIINQPGETIENTTYCQRVRYVYFNHFDYADYRNLHLKYDMQQHNFSITFNPNNDSNEIITIPSNFTYPYNPFNIPNNLLLINFESFSVGIENEEIEITNNMTYIKEFQSNFIVERNHFTIYLGQAFLISLKPIFTCEMIIKDNDSSETQLCKLELNPQLEQIPIQLEPNKIIFGVYPRSNPIIVRFETTKIFSFTDLISSLGGFYGGVTGIFVFLFGMRKVEPCNKSLKRNFAKKYVSSAGIPLVEKVNERPEGSSIDDRVQILENLLKDYYLDDYCLKKVKEVITKHERYKKYDKILNPDDIDNAENTHNTDI
ncbi:hypothetical protein C1645_830346 [Glomus cerebriforme]|uniref:Transmembrane protein n=1 Tax=Glomus cerebriforme TaxID=658196 RepID=A0A397SSW0_9GLOM|nr:hypothetical protein C1645_830346 [Glomus cerebriforme]